MLLKYFYDTALAHASYIVGCQKTGEAIVIDASRDIQRYLDAAAEHDVSIVAAAETHIHADFVAGSRELAERANAKLFLSDEGPDDWKYSYAKQYDSQLLKDGDDIHVGKVKLTALHTPGHTPEHLSFFLTDEGGGADEPMGLFTGDFVFVNSVGRPDLLETAAGVQGNADSAARDLFRSVEKFKTLAKHLQLWPAHGAGSSCGKGLGAIPSSTVGYELMFSPAMQFDDEQKFVDYILDDQPETPPYFKIMKRVNKEGPNLLSEFPAGGPIGVEQLKTALDKNKAVVDTRNPHLFAVGHVPGTILIPVGKLGDWAGWFVDYEKPVYVIAEKYQRDEVIRVMTKIGIDSIAGLIDADAVSVAGLNTQSFPERSPKAIADQVANGDVTFVDVRSESEWNEGHVPQAKHHYLGKLPDHVSTLKTDRPIVTQCQSGVRSAIAASILQAHGINDIINLDGGFAKWKSEGLLVEEPKSKEASE